MFIEHNSKFHFSILLIYQIYNDFNHHLHLFGAGLTSEFILACFPPRSSAKLKRVWLCSRSQRRFGDHQSEGDEGVVADQWCAVGLIENAVAGKEPQEQERRDALVSI